MTHDEERRPLESSQEPILNPNPAHNEEYPAASSMGLRVTIVVVVLVAVVLAGYGWMQHNSARQSAANRAELQASLAQAKTQVADLSARVNALSAAHAQQAAAQAQAEAAKNQQLALKAGEAPRHGTRRVIARRHPTDDPRWKQVQQQLSDQQRELADSQKQIAATQANLDQTKADLQGAVQSARSDLGDGIARNHSELVALERKGERNYFEFSFEKSKIFHHTGPISIALRKADAKHQYCDLQLLVDDREITRKHVNLYESVALYPDGYPLPLEVVINRISKGSAQGYVSAPKYRATTQQATAAAPPPASTAANPPAATTAPDAELAHRDTAAH